MSFLKDMLDTKVIPGIDALNILYVPMVLVVFSFLTMTLLKKQKPKNLTCTITQYLHLIMGSFHTPQN